MFGNKPKRTCSNDFVVQCCEDIANAETHDEFAHHAEAALYNWRQGFMTGKQYVLVVAAVLQRLNLEARQKTASKAEQRRLFKMSELAHPGGGA